MDSLGVLWAVHPTAYVVHMPHRKAAMRWEYWGPRYKPEYIAAALRGMGHSAAVAATTDRVSPCRWKTRHMGVKDVNQAICECKRPPAAAQPGNGSC